MGGPGRRFDLAVAGPGGGIGDVFAQGAVEQEHVLVDDAQQRAVGFDVQLTQVASVDLDPAERRVVESGHEVAEGRLAGPAGADQGHGLAGLDPQVDVRQGKTLGTRIAETDVRDRDLPGQHSPVRFAGVAAAGDSQGSASRSSMRCSPTRPFCAAAALLARLSSGPISMASRLRNITRSPSDKSPSSTCRPP